MDLTYERRRTVDAVRGLRLYRAQVRRDHWSPERLRAHQQQRLDALARHAVAHSPFWRERLGSGPVDLAAVPALDKTTLMKNFDDIVCDRRLRRDELLEHLDGLDHDALHLGRYRVMTTSGSSGHKALYVYDRRGWQQIAGYWFRHCAMTGKLPRVPRRRLVFVGGGAPADRPAGHHDRERAVHAADGRAHDRGLGRAPGRVLRDDGGTLRQRLRVQPRHPHVRGRGDPRERRRARP